MAFLRTIDPKLIAAGATYLLTKLLLSQGIELEGDLIPGYLSIAQGVALVAAGIAGWWKSNVGTVLRNPPEMHDGNPDAELVREKLPG